VSRFRCLPGNRGAQAKCPVKQRDKSVGQHHGCVEAVDLSAAIDARQDCSTEFRLGRTDFDGPFFADGVVYGFDDADVEQAFLGR